MDNKRNKPSKVNMEKLVQTGKKIWSFVPAVARIAFGAAATVLLVLVVCCFAFAGVLGDYLQNDILPAADMDIEGYDYEQNSTLYYLDEDGKIQIYQQIFAETSSKWADYEDIPQDMINAAIAIEDHRFYEHQGVDWITTIKACARMFFGDDSVGGSSITQQLIKNVLLQSEDDTADDVTVRRKVMEIFRAVQMEKRYDKKTIMENYLNCIYLGQNCRGVRSAAATYFGKELEMLTTAECASIISITNSPTYYDPYQNFDNNKERKEDVLWAMKEYGLLDEQSYEEAIAQEIVLKSGIDDEDRLAVCPNTECNYTDIRKNFDAVEGGYVCPRCSTLTPTQTNASQEIYSWYTEAVLEDVAKALIERDGMVWNDSTKEMYMKRIQTAGYNIFICLDMAVQQQVDKIYTNLEEIPDTRSGQQLRSAMVVIGNETGDVVAMAGDVGKKEGFDYWNMATDAKLQSGSSIKPLAIYAPAFESGAVTPATVIKDLPMTYDNGAWPRNADWVYSYSKTIFSGVVSSTNAIAANTLDLIGTKYSYDFAKNKFGLSTLIESYTDSLGIEHSDIDYAPLAMGAQTWGVTVRDMANGFSTFANGGEWRGARTFTKVYDSEGNLVLDNTQQKEKILSDKTVDYMNYCLVNATQSGTGYEADLSWNGITTAGKTGTTADNKDRWYCGFTGYYTAAVWCGYEDPEVIYLTGGVNNPSAVLWKKVMKPLHSGLSNVALYNSGKLSGVSMCLDSGKMATAACKADIRSGSSFTRIGNAAVYWEDMPDEQCDQHVLLDYCVTGSGVATQYCQNFASVDATVKLEQKALVKMTRDDVEEIQKAKSYRLGSQYYRDDYVYLINDDGTDGNWKGFSGSANKNVSAPYVVCTLHTKAAWDAHQAANPVEPVDPVPDVTQ